MSCSFNLFRYSFDSAFSWSFPINISNPSSIIVPKSTTIGTPIAITGMPKVFSLNSFLAFPTPAPGIIPVSAICIVLLILSILFEAKLSITITSLGCILSTIPFIISEVSIPVVPKTPGEIAVTGLVLGSIYSGVYFKKCLVISISFITLGPNESGVTYKFPKPTTNISSFIAVCLFISSFSSPVTASAAFPDLFFFS